MGDGAGGEAALKAGTLSLTQLTPCLPSLALSLSSLSPSPSLSPSLSLPLSLSLSPSLPLSLSLSQIRTEPVFKETLDYLFFGPPSAPLALRRVAPLPAVVAAAAAAAAGPAAAPLPNDSEPSDHVLIAAEFDLP